MSRTTVRQAIDLLVMEGLLFRRQGIGTFVAEPKLEHALGKFTSFSDDIKRRGSEPGSKLLHLEVVSPSRIVARALGLQLDEPVILVERLRLADGEPIGIHKSFLCVKPKLKLEDFQDGMAEADASLYSFLSRKGIDLIEGTETIEAVPAGEDEAQLLGVKFQAPLLLISRIAYDRTDTAVEFCRMIYRADRYRYSVHLYQ